MMTSFPQTGMNVMADSCLGGPEVMMECERLGFEALNFSVGTHCYINVKIDILNSLFAEQISIILSKISSFYRFHILFLNFYQIKT